MKRLLYIQYCFGTGGLNKITSVKENYFANHGYEIHNLSLIDVEEHYAELYDASIKRHSLHLNQEEIWMSAPLIRRLKRFFNYRWRLLKAIVNIHPDVIIVNQPTLEPLSVVLLTCWKKRIMEFHGWFNPKSSIKEISLHERFQFKTKYRFYHIIALTKREAQHIHKMSGRSASYISNPLFSFPEKASSCQEKRVVSMARFSPPKKLDTILPYWKEVQKRHPDWELHLYGEGPDEPVMRSVISEFQLTSVHIHPYTNDVEKELIQSSIYILPSWYEGFPLVLLECMSAGVPCVAYDCPCGPAEIISNGVDGFVTAYMNPQALMEKVLYLIEHDDVRIEMGKKARMNIQRYDMDSIMQQWMNLFEQL